MDGQIHFGHVQQIPDLVHVDLEVGDLDLELELRVHGVDVVEDVLDDARNDALHLLAVEFALHGVRLARRGLPVGEYGAIVAAQHVLHNLLGRRVVDHLLRRVRPEDAVEHVALARHDARVLLLVRRELDHDLAA